ncbi:unnamed protein product [Rhizoctonia solani]|uniref:Uncharacterized protein n=1 Tax=Rhizoctonia solani TaxID=456999 RepID=A0A8H2XLZ3_9AGAM|nr:unnamed protein product [Rhizoctonia solani]
MDTVNTPTVLPSDALVAPPNPGISLVELYNLSDHEAQACTASPLVEAALAVWTSLVGWQLITANIV